MALSLLEMPAGIFFISLVLVMLYIFVESRITKDKKSYFYYIKYGLFIGFMNVILMSLSHGRWPSLPSMPTALSGGGSVLNTDSVMSSPAVVSTSYSGGLPESF